MTRTHSPRHLLTQAQTLEAAGKPGEALLCYERLLAKQPADAALHFYRANVLQSLDRLDDALASFERAMALDANYFEPVFNKGGLLQQMGQHGASLDCYARVLAIRPGFADAYCNQGNALLALKRHTEALQAYDKALQLKPDLSTAYCNRGNTLGELRRYDEAMVDYDRAIALAPTLSAAWSNRGNVLKKMGRLPEALQSYQQAVTVKPGNAKAQFNVALAHLVLGDFAQGWPLYEWRWKDGLKHRQRHYPQPLWLGEGDVAGKTVFIYREQGLGDTLQFCRYAQLLAERGARVVLEVQEPLYDVLQGLPGVAQWVRSGEALPAFDLHCPLLSLPLAFATREDSIPGRVPYVHADATKVAHWQARLALSRTHAAQLRIGLVSTGSPTHVNDDNRSLPLTQLLAAVPAGWQRVCLHKVLRDADAQTVQQHPEVLFFGDELHDFSDTAALVACLDVVLTVDTSVAHLAAAMGKPTYLLLPFAPDWRWLLQRSDSPWYPSVRLFRQQAPADWHGALAQVHEALLGHGKAVTTNRSALGFTSSMNNTEKTPHPTHAATLKLAQQHYQAERYRECLNVLQPLMMQPSGTTEPALQVLRMAGACLFNLGQPAQAAQAFEQVTQRTRAGKADAQDWLNLASALDQAKQWEQAEAAYVEALRCKPDFTLARLQWCALLRTLGRQEEAQAELENALTVLPSDAPASERAMLLHAQGVVAHELGGYAAARPLMMDALTLNPEFYEARYHVAMGALAHGDNAAGWTGFEWRWGQSQAAKAWRNFGEGPPTASQLAVTSWTSPAIDNTSPALAESVQAPQPRPAAPLWRGQPLGEASLLVWEEQGLGDGLQFFRYMALLREREPHATLLFWCRATLHSVFAAWAQQHRVQLLPAESLKPEQVRGQEWHVPLMSLPFCLRESGYPPTAGTVTAPLDKLPLWQERMARYTSGTPCLRQVGLVWSGNQIQTMSTRRNLALQQLAPWLAVPGVQWHSLQLGASAGDVALSDWQGHIVDWSHHLKDFGDTAALVTQLDWVITVDTSTAHLAANLGKPTWVLSRYDACWRWLLARDDSPWYPSVRLFRQPTPFDWDSVIEAVKHNLDPDALTTCTGPTEL